MTNGGTTRRVFAVRAGLAAVATGALLALAAPAQASPYVANIGWMSSNHTGVKCVQDDLYANGYYSGAIDGLFGSGTLKGVETLQHSVGLPADGIVGKDTGSVILADMKDLGIEGNCWSYVPSHS